MKGAVLCLTLTLCLCLLHSVEGRAQNAGVCNRQAAEVADGIANDVERRIQAVWQTTLPDDEKRALVTLHIGARNRAFNQVELSRRQCTVNYMPKQQMVNMAVYVYTAGLSEFLPPSLTYVDVSEIMNGRPLGGPDALVPRAREQILRGDNSTPSNIVRDPIRCLTFQRRC